eukprot:ANDGO_00254.mRNA.1 hypothetical protein
MTVVRLIATRDFPRTHSLLSAEEVNQCAAFYFERDAKNHCAHRLGLRYVEFKETGHFPLAIEKDANGKPQTIANGSHDGTWVAIAYHRTQPSIECPALRGRSSAEAGLSMSLSPPHSPSSSSSSSSSSPPIGVDIMPCEMSAIDPMSVRLCLSEYELSVLRHNRHRLSVLWTIKEAICKCDGRGMSMDLSAVSIQKLLDIPCAADLPHGQMILLPAGTVHSTLYPSVDMWSIAIGRFEDYVIAVCSPVLGSEILVSVLEQKELLDWADHAVGSLSGANLPP